MIFRHADGSIKFWDASAGTLQVLYKLKTAKLFEKGRTRSIDSEEDPLAIQLIFLCPESRKLAIAGSGRHVVLFKFKKVESMSEVVVSNLFVIYVFVFVAFSDYILVNMYWLTARTFRR